MHKDKQEAEVQKEFYSFLAEELIDNNYDSVGGQGRSRMEENAQETRPSIARCQTLDCRGADLVLTLLPPKERDTTRENLQRISTRVCVKSVS
jgi:hypothetical protein